METLYKQNSSGNWLVWSVEVKQHRYRTTSGLEGGKLVTSRWREASAKNLGKSNVVTATKQAELEVASKYQAQLDKGYAYTKDEAIKSTNALLRPMLANTLQEHENKIKYPCWIQPKINGVRGEVTVDKVTSKTTKPLSGFNYLIPPREAFSGITSFDGELYKHLYRDNLNKITGIVSRIQDDKSGQLELWVFDCIAPGTFLERYELLTKLMKDYKLERLGYKLVPTYECKNREDIEKYYDQFIKEGFEGAIVRMNSKYEHKRTSVLLKYKKFQDKEFKIIDAIEGKGNRKSTIGKFVFSHNGEVFKANVLGDFSYLRKIWKDRKTFIGKTATVKFFKFTPRGVPQHGIVTQIARETYE